MNIYTVSFQYSERTFCSNIAKAENTSDVEAHYSKYANVSITEATKSDLLEAERKGKPVIICEHIEEAQEDEKMENATIKSYEEQVKNDVEMIITNYYSISEIKNSEDDEINDILKELNDKMWIDDSVTGNGSGSYTFSRAEAKENVLANLPEVVEALQEFTANAAEELSKKIKDEEWEYLDVSARCYFLSSAIQCVVDDIRA